MDKRQFLEQIIEEIRGRDIVPIIRRYIPLTRKGVSHYALCPFHNDTRMGSFIVTARKGIFKCFSCGVGGDIIKFVAELKGLNYVESAFEIALDERIITLDEYEGYFKRRRFYKKEIKTIEKIYTKKDLNKFKSNKGDIEVLNIIFKVFLSTLKLQPRHKKYLAEERDLSEDIIVERNYKTYPYFTRDLIRKIALNIEREGNANEFFRKKIEKIMREQKKEGISLTFAGAAFYVTPGFYQKKTSDGSWEWVFPRNKGILMPIRNSDGLIQGLQVRRDEEDEDRGRYIWFSSAFAEYSDRFRYGTSSGSPLDVVYPENTPDDRLFITEGRFKSEIIAKKINSTSISVQGVANWRGIDKEIKKAEKNRKDKYPNFKGFSKIYIAFDSDMSYKYQVYEQLKRMSDYLEKQTNVCIFYLHWDGEYKGIDDLLLNNECNTPEECANLVTRYTKSYWDREYEKQLNKILKERNVSYPRDLKQDDLKKINIPKKRVRVS